ncbi:MAG: glycosyltransferase family 39 protein, partial [Proteobacteria bacterium]|nr:glycosyltransferase family 39 protein [Pseudomonadota bacterium]
MDASRFSNPSDKILNNSDSVRNVIVILIILLGFLIRLYVCLNTAIVNPDGPLYIHQARALYYGQWDQLTSCALNHLSIYPFLIAGAFHVFHDWIIAAKVISLFFGTLLLIPAYLLFRSFFERHVSAAATLTVALIPVLVTRSADVVRDPVAWFFALLGLSLFVFQYRQRSRTFVILSSISYLVAAATRVEYSLFLILSFLFILFREREMKLEKLLYFAIPIAATVFFALLGAKILDSSIHTIFRVDEILQKWKEPLLSYKALRANLDFLSSQPVTGTLELFLEKAGNLVWLVGLGTLVVYIIKAFFYPFFLIFLLGFKGIPAGMKKDRAVTYLLMLSGAALLLLYLHIVQAWFASSRFFVFFMLPSLILLGYGLEETVRILRSRFRLNAKVALTVVFLFVMAFGLPKNLKPRETDKLVFINIGEFMAMREGNAGMIKVASSLHILRWTSFYANLHYQGAPCPQPLDLNNLIGKSYGEFLHNLRKEGIKYFLWEE